MPNILDFGNKQSNPPPMTNSGFSGLNMGTSNPI